MQFAEESMREIVGLAGAVLGQDDLAGIQREVCRIAVRAVPDCDGASLTSFEQGKPSAVAADDAWAQRLDELQYEEREGPCLDATRTGNVFRLRDLRDEPRWPFYAPHALELGALSAVSLPMAAEGQVLGALNLYSRKANAFSAGAVSLGELLAAQAGMATQVAASFFRHRDLGEQLRQAMQSRAGIEQAKGVLMAAHRCDEDKAFALLVERSQHTNRRLRDVAQDVVAQASGRAPAG